MAAERRAEKPQGEGTRSLRSVPGAGTGAANFDKLIHEQLRLGIVSALAAAESLSFTELKERLAATDGNLSVHARRLEEAGYVACKKTFRERTPRTEFRLTAKGRRALTKYLDHMEALIRAARGGE
jgi:DNA-binding MarR family transcriptional regulator